MDLAECLNCIKNHYSNGMCYRYSVRRISNIKECNLSSIKQVSVTVSLECDSTEALFHLANDINNSIVSVNNYHMFTNRLDNINNSIHAGGIDMNADQKVLYKTCGDLLVNMHLHLANKELL